MRNRQRAKEYNHQYYLDNREILLPKIRERVRKWHHDPENKKKRNLKLKELRIQEREEKGVTQSSIRSRRARARLKTEVVEHMGGKCQCCGENGIDFLTIDHVANNGNRERKEKIFKPGGANSFRQARKLGYPEDLQLLCFNCNYSKHVGRGVCLHQRSTDSSENIDSLAIFTPVKLSTRD